MSQRQCQALGSETDTATNVNVKIRLLEERDVQPIVAAFHELRWNTKSASLYQRYLSEQEEGRRTVLVAFENGTFAGYATVQWSSGYPPFREEKTPEFTDFNVLPRFRRRGIGTLLMDEAERRIAKRSQVAGIGVGMDPDYGAAQRMYVLRGYVPDGRGLTQGDRHVRYGDRVVVDDGLNLWLTKRLHHGGEPRDLPT